MWVGQSLEKKGEVLRRKVKEGDLQTVMEIAGDCAAAVNLPDKGDGWNALMIAAATGRLEILKYLVSNGADVNMKDPVNGWTALMCAAAKSRMDIATWLVQNGADMTIISNSNKSALDLMRDPGKRATLVQAANSSQKMSVAQGMPFDGNTANGVGAGVEGNISQMSNLAKGGAGVSLAGLTAAQLLAHKLASRQRAQRDVKQATLARTNSGNGATAIAPPPAAAPSMPMQMETKLLQQQQQPSEEKSFGPSPMHVASATLAFTPQTAPSSAIEEKTEQRRRLADAVLRNAGQIKAIAAFEGLRNSLASANTPPPAAPTQTPLQPPQPQAPSTATTDATGTFMPALAPAMSTTVPSSTTTSSSASAAPAGSGSIADQLKSYVVQKQQGGDAVNRTPQQQLEAAPRRSPNPLASLATLGEQKNMTEEEKRRLKLNSFLSAQGDESDEEDGLKASPSPSHSPLTRNFYEPPSVSFSEPLIRGQERVSSPDGRSTNAVAAAHAAHGTSGGIDTSAVANWVQQVRDGHSPKPPSRDGLSLDSSGPATPLTGLQSTSAATTPGASGDLSSRAMSTAAGRQWSQDKARDEAEAAAAAALAQRSSDKKKREEMAQEKSAKTSVEEWVKRLRQGDTTPPPALPHLGIASPMRYGSGGSFDTMTQSSPQMSPMMAAGRGSAGTTVSEPGSLNELRGDVRALTITVNQQGQQLERCFSTIEAQKHTIDRLTEELKSLMGKQARLSEESEMMRVKELGALNVVERRLEEVKMGFDQQLQRSMTRIHETLTEQVHDQMSNTAMDLIKGREASDRQLRAEISSVKSGLSQEMQHFKELLDQIVTAL